MKLKVLSHPHIDDYANSKHESGVRRIIEIYFSLLPKYDIELVDRKATSYDVHVAHAGATGKDCDVAQLHGLYWTGDYESDKAFHAANHRIVKALWAAKQVIVPSEWVAETIRRDMRFNPHVIGHGIDYKLWQPRNNDGYVLWNKNRNIDVCDPTPMVELARKSPKMRFLTTYTPRGHDLSTSQNIKEIGLQPHADMKKLIESANVYLSTTKETFGIGILEALAAGVPVLGFAWGGNLEMVEHGINGYLAKPGSIDDLKEGLEYCIKHRDVLSKNALETVKQWSWDNVVGKVADVYKLANEPHPYEKQTSVVIPCYNYEEKLPQAVESVVNQTRKPLEIILVDDGSTDGTFGVAEELALKHDIVKAYTKVNGGVATTRNYGINLARGQYIICLDADDKIAERFIEVCGDAMDKDPSLGMAYTSLYAVSPKGSGKSSWPGDCDHDLQMKYRNPGNARGLNQVPTCCMFRRKMWERTGGYKQRYAPLGAGSEDAEFFTRGMSIGFRAKRVSEEPMFIYSAFTGLVSGNREKADPDLVEPPWLVMHPWAKDRKHPFASLASPENKIAHPVHQYDRPLVSIVIPVGEGHEKEVYNAIDSVEAQSFRNWEIVIAWDSPNEHNLSSYPFVKIVETGGNKGAGYSRNRGAEKARAPFLVFLDADDQLAPEFLEKTLVAFREYKSIIYTDYVNSVITNAEGVKDFGDDLISYNKRTKIAMVAGRSADYECERAQRQPSKDLFHWCLVTCLVPKVWHDAIGGFDETMESFEDALYHWVMAKNGYCYVRFPEPLVNYRMYTGKRREKASIYTEQGRIVAKKMLQYSEQVLKEIEAMGCNKCPGGRGKASPSLNVIQETPVPVTRATDEDFVEVEYTHPNIGNHHIYGAITRIHYGYRGGGAKMLVHKKDIEAQPQLFKPIVRHVQHIVIEPEKQVTAPPEPITEQEISSSIGIPMTIESEQEALQEPDLVEQSPTEPPQEIVSTPPVAQDNTDLASIPGVTPNIHKQLQQLGCRTHSDVLALGHDELMKLNGVGHVRAEMMMEFLSIDN